MNKVDFPVGYVWSQLSSQITFVCSPAKNCVRLPQCQGQEARRPLGRVSYNRGLGGSFCCGAAGSNYLLNPGHPDFGEILVEPGVPFVVDERLFK
jgi:hypothetical protein